MKTQPPLSFEEATLAVLPELRPSITLPVRWLSLRQLDPRTVRTMRLLESLMALPTRLRATRRCIPGLPGRPEVNIHVIDRRPTSGRPRATPALLYLHGGGYVMGSAAMRADSLAQLSCRLDCLVISVDYRLAPETPFPGALDDNYAALRWLHLNANELGIDARRIAVMGDSAGGGHAAALALTVRDRGELSLCCQVLIYPMLDDRTAHEAGPEWSGHFAWSAASNRFAWSALLGCPAGAASVPTGAVPARAEYLEGLAPAWIGVGSLDLFHDEDVAYAARLEQADVPVELLVQPGAYHGFDYFAPRSDAAIAFSESWTCALIQAFRADA